MKITCNLSTEPIIVVRFHADGATLFFGSLSAIYEAYSDDEVGIPLYKLWKRGLLQQGLPYDTGKCTITRSVIYRKRQQNQRSTAAD